MNLLLGGYDKIADKPTLYWIDYLASLAPVPYAAHGYAQYVTTDFGTIHSPLITSIVIALQCTSANSTPSGTTASRC